MLELFGVYIQIFMVEAVFYLVLDEVFQHFHVDQVACFRVNFSTDLYFQLVVVPVITGIIAEPEYFFVFLVRPVWVVEPVCGIEVCRSEYADTHR